METFRLFMAVLGLRCCGGFSLAAVHGGYPLGGVLRLLVAVASLQSMGSGARRLQ